MKFSQLVLRFFILSLISFVVSVVLVFLYGQYDEFAGYLLFFVPISAGISGLLLTALQAFKPRLKLWILILLTVPFSVIGFFILMVFVFNSEILLGRPM